VENGVIMKALKGFFKLTGYSIIAVSIFLFLYELSMRNMGIEVLPEGEQVLLGVHLDLDAYTWKDNAAVGIKYPPRDCWSAAVVNGKIELLCSTFGSTFILNRIEISMTEDNTLRIRRSILYERLLKELFD